MAQSKDQRGFNPDENELKFDVDADPADMTPEQRTAAAKHTIYEAYRQITATKAAVDYLAELAGVPAEEITAVSEQAEEDEVAELSGLDEYEVADSYEDAAAGRTRTVR